MSMLAAGYPCPDCGSIGPHHITRLDDGKPPSGMVLYCHHDEKVWYEKLGPPDKAGSRLPDGD